MLNIRTFDELAEQVEEVGLDNTILRANLLIDDETLLNKVRIYLKVYANLKEYIIKSSEPEGEKHE